MAHLGSHLYSPICPHMLRFNVTGIRTIVNGGTWSEYYYKRNSIATKHAACEVHIVHICSLRAMQR